MAITLKPLDEQVIVITGASSGIGLATARTAIKKGARLVLASRSEETLSELVAEIKEMGGEAIHVLCDVGDRTEVERVADEAVSRFGHIDTWINNAGVSIYGKMEEVSERDMRKLFDTNFWGVVSGSLVALRHMKTRGGAIINVGSEVSEAVVPLQGIYTASKHAVKGFTDVLRVEVEEIDQAPVSITLIQPGATDTPFPQNAKNYMEQEPKLPDPMSDPQAVADAILEAAVKPMRDVKVGAMSKINTLVAKLIPSLGDKMSAKQADRQHYDEPPRNPEGTLDHAGESGQVRGSGGVEPST